MYEIFEKLLKEHGVTAYRVAKETGVTTATLTSWKQGKYTPKREKLQKIADYFGVSLEYLMHGESKPSYCDLPAPEVSIVAEAPAPYYTDKEAAKTAQEIYDNDKILFDVYRTVDKDRLVEFAKKLAELRKLEEGDE